MIDMPVLERMKHYSELKGVLKEVSIRSPLNFSI